MNLARHSITATSPIHIYDARFDADCQIFTTCTPAGFAIYRACPMTLLRKRELSGGTLAAAVPMHTSSLLFLIGGGRSPLFPPNKVILWDDAIGSEVAEFEFRERVRGITCRRGWLAVALKRRVVVFEVGEQITRFAEWDTCDNPRGLVSIATAAHSTLLAIPGRQMGHVQLIHLPPCPVPKSRGPPPSGRPPKPPNPPSKHPVSIIIAHNTALTTLSLPPSGRLLATTSSRGTLVRIWDTLSGHRVHEFRRGTDKADIYGVAFRPDEAELCVWSDKGTVHVFTLAGSNASNRQSSISQLAPYLPIPKYFESEWSYTQYRIPTQSSHISINTTTRSPTEDIPDEERCVVGWVKAPVDDSPNAPIEHQLIALTYVGGWYRLALPSSSSSSSSSGGKPAKTQLPQHMSSRSSVASSSSPQRSKKDKERHNKGRENKVSQCSLQEYRRFGRWDGWG